LNVRVTCENGEVAYEPLLIIARPDPGTCAIYAKENGLSHLPGWQSFKD